MNRQPFAKPPRWWSPLLSTGWIRFWRPWRKRAQFEKQRLVSIDVRGLDHLRGAIDAGCGVLITPNHSSHADCFAYYEASERLQCPFYVMIAWQNFVRDGWLKSLALRHHGGFSVDREGTDLRAFRQAVEILQSRPNPLVIFPEGEVYHLNQRITPFREGPAAMALLAARQGDRPVVCVPCGIRYRYIDDPTPELLRVMDELERAIYWRPRPDLPLAQRIYHFAEGALALKEIEFMGRTSAGPVPQRVAELVQHVLYRIESRYGLRGDGVSVPERVKALRRHAIDELAKLPDDSPERRSFEADLDDAFFVVQLFSYPGDYVSQQPSVERIAETIDKLEEDVLGRKTARIRGTRRATVAFGEPIRVEAERGKKAGAAALTRLLEERVQALLDAPAADSDSGRRVVA